MELIYKTVESLNKPLEIDTTISPNWVYIRKDITSVETDNGTKFVYQEACITPEEFKQTDLYQTHTQAMKNITKRQLLIWLYLNAGKTEEDIYTAINAIPDATTKYLATVNYSGTNNFYYGNNYVQVIGAILGLTVDQLKTMFDEASTL